ncbi:MAG: c-type cytochrome, partial [Rhizobacter sp.]
MKALRDTCWKDGWRWAAAVAGAALLAVQGLPARAQPASQASAQGSPASGAQPASGVGAQIATQGAPNAAACIGCHGAAGEGNAAAGFPRIAGHYESYLVRQLDAYASGARQNPVMGPIAKALNDQQRRAVSAYYATLQSRGATAAAGPAASAVPAAALQRAAQLANAGDESLKVQACANCHGPGGIGQAPSYPYLAGQHAGYLQAALGEWKSGARKTDPSGQMVQIAQALGDADVRGLAAYFSRLPAPSPRDADVATAWQTRTAAVTSGPRPAAGGDGSQATQGVGTEQGAPLTGGAQGPGGGGAATGGGSQGSATGQSQTGASQGGPGTRGPSS